jgi:hypothetical protein
MAAMQAVLLAASVMVLQVEFWLTQTVCVQKVSGVMLWQDAPTWHAQFNAGSSPNTQPVTQVASWQVPGLHRASISACDFCAYWHPPRATEQAAV